MCEPKPLCPNALAMARLLREVKNYFDPTSPLIAEINQALANAGGAR